MFSSLVQKAKSTFGVKSTPEVTLEAERRLKPYKHAIFKITRLAAGILNYSYIKNDFGTNFIKSYSEVGIGIYSFIIDDKMFKDLSMVSISADLTHTTVTKPSLSAFFTDVTFGTASVTVVDASTLNFATLDGEVIVTIKEYYG